MSLIGCILLKQDLYHTSVDICLCRAEDRDWSLAKEHLYNTEHIVDTEQKTKLVSVAISLCVVFTFSTQSLAKFWNLYKEKL